MGLFNRKPKRSNGHVHSSTPTTQSSPPPAKAINGQSFTSPSIPDVSLPSPPDPHLDPAAYLRSIYAVRDRCRLVYSKASTNQLQHFDVDWSKWQGTVEYVGRIIKRDHAPDYSKIPSHGRWQHFEVGGHPRIDQLLTTWPSNVDAQERTRRLLDLFLVSVLLDAGAGTRWSYKSKESGKVYRRSEGLAVASLEMFKAGYFSSVESQPYQVDAQGLRKLDAGSLARGLQVSTQNPLAGLEGRAGLMERLGKALMNQEFFGKESRPGCMLDYLLSHPTTSASSVPIITIPTLWSLLITSLTPVFSPPSTNLPRTTIDNISLGDSWPCSSLPNHPQSLPWERIAPFHKLTQWLTYSLMAPMQRLMGAVFVGEELLTGLPEYRNGGLLIDTGLLTLKGDDSERGLRQFRERGKAGGATVEVVPLFSTDDDVVVEWRAVTVGFLDELLVEVNAHLGLKGAERLKLAQMLEAGSWKGGRELAEVSRPNTKEPPIMIMSDGTVF